jgi:hypothetical protein
MHEAFYGNQVGESSGYPVVFYLMFGQKLHQALPRFEPEKQSGAPLQRIVPGRPGLATVREDLGVAEAQVTAASRPGEDGLIFWSRLGPPRSARCPSQNW